MERKIFGSAVKVLVGLVVALFLGLHSINFFRFTFPADQQLYAWLGFGLTGGAAIGYLIVFVTEANTPLKRVVSLVMMVVAMGGEILTAYYGVQVETWRKLGFTLTETDYQSMLQVVMVLAFLHAVALIAYIAGDKIAWMFGDEDKDGKWDGFQSRTNVHEPRQNRTSDTQRDSGRISGGNRPEPQAQGQGTSYKLADLTQKTGKTAGQLRADFADYPAFAAWASNQFDHISGGNMKRIWYGEVNPTKATTANPNGRR